MKTTTNFRTIRLVQLALFTSIILLMAFTPLGYIRTPGVEITLLVVPVAVGAIVLGPLCGAILGGVFGITSFIQCFGMSPFGAALLGINPAGTFILCLLPRILMGLFTGLIFTGLRKLKKFNKTLPYAAANLAGAFLNTALFMTTLVLLFYQTDYIQGIAQGLNTHNPFTFILAFVTINGLIEAIVCFILGTAVSKAIDVFAGRSGFKTSHK